jgi:four helix bundle protein
LSISIRSGIEVVCCLYLARRRKLINEDTFDHFYNYLSQLLKRIQALRNSIR